MGGLLVLISWLLWRVQSLHFSCKCQYLCPNYFEKVGVIPHVTAGTYMEDVVPHVTAGTSVLAFWRVRSLPSSCKCWYLHPNNFEEYIGIVPCVSADTYAPATLKSTVTSSRFKVSVFIPWSYPDCFEEYSDFILHVDVSTCLPLL